MKILLRIYFKPVWLSFFCGTYFNCFGSHSESEWGSKQHWNSHLDLEPSGTQWSPGKILECFHSKP